MTLLDRARVVSQLGRAALAWLRLDTGYPSPVPENPKFMTPRDAVRLIRDGDVLATSGLGGNQRAAVLYAAIREAFAARGHPAHLTVISLGGQGGRGRAPGTLEELGQRGLCTRLIAGHFETYRAMLELAAQGECELQCIPQGTLALLLDGLGRGRTTRLSAVGVGTALDPRVGHGSAVGGAGEALITAHGARLRYRIPPVDVALFNAPAADRRGNLYASHCAMIGETVEIARAAKRNGGRVIANVGLLVEEGHDRVLLPAEMVDAVVYHPDTEQTAGVPHREHWSAVTIASDVSIADALERVHFVNQLAGMTARRGAADHAVARLAASVLLANVRRGATVNIGVGLPEEVARAVFEAGRLDDVTFAIESGVIGGLPASGVYFGAALCPRAIHSSAQVFRQWSRHLDATCLGALQVDSLGNVNVSRRGAGPRHYVGPGGFIDLTAAARVIVFVSPWMVHGEVAIADGRLRIARAGAPKFVERVDEITFDAARALAAGKRVFYATHVGLFRLTGRGVELAAVMPGIDVRRDILGATPMRILRPRSGRVPLLPTELLDGGASLVAMR